MLSTKAAPAAPGAYQAEVPNKPVSVAPPTMVSAAIFSNSDSLNKLLIANPFKVAKRVKGIIVVSP